MFRIILFYLLIVYSIIFIILDIKNIIETFKEGSIKKAIIFIILNIILAVISFRKFNILGFGLNILTTELIALGILNFIITLYDENDFYYYTIVFWITLVITCIMYFSGIKFANNIFFDYMPSNITSHYRKIDTKKEAKKMDPEKELKLVLDTLKQKGVPINYDTINKEIGLYNYRRYNGIYCYHFKEYDEYYEIGMTIGENNYFFQSKDMTKPFNFKVEKNSLKITIDE